MRNAPRLCLALRPSKRLRWALFGAAGATAACAACMPIPWAFRLALVLAVLLATVRVARRTLGRGLPTLVHLGADRRLTVTGQDGRSTDGVVLADSFVGPRCTTIVWCADARAGLRRQRRAALLVLSDMLSPEDFRQLRVLLRYGWAGPVAGATSADAAERPPSQAAPS